MNNEPTLNDILIALSAYAEKSGDAGLQKLVRQLEQLAAQAGDSISVGNMTDNVGVAIGNNISQIINYTNLPSDLLALLKALVATPKPDSVLPPRPTIFVGRETEIEDLYQALTQDRIVVLSGMFGIGKTQLAAEYSHRYKKNYLDGVFWAEELNQTGLSLLATYSGLSGMSEVEKIVAFFRFIKEHPKALLVFDNLDDPLQLGTRVAGQVVQELPCHILVTTRRTDTGLTNCEIIKLNSLPNEQAGKLLLKAAQRHNVAETEKQAANGLCGLLGNLPLLIYLVAVYLKDNPGISLMDYWHRLEIEGLLTPIIDVEQELGNIELALRHPAITMTLNPLWEGLPVDNNSRQVLKTAALLCGNENQVTQGRLALFSGLPIKSKMAAHPSPLNRALKSLLNSSLVEVWGKSEIRIRIHSLVREFASRQKLSPEAHMAFLTNLHKVMVDKENPEVDRRRAAFLLTQSRWFKNIPSTSLGADELLAYLELVVRSLELDKDRRYILVHGILPVTAARLAQWANDRQWASLWNFSAILYAQLARFDKAAVAFQETRNLLEKVLETKDRRPEDYKLVARVNLGSAGVLIDRTKKDFPDIRKQPLTPVQQQEVNTRLSPTVALYQKAVEAAQAYGQDPILEANIWNDFSYILSLMGQWEQAETAQQRATEVLQEHLRCYCDILETASYIDWKNAQQAQEKALAKYEDAYCITLEEIQLAQRSLRDSDTLVRAHMNAADYLVEIGEFPPGSFSNPIKTACQHWNTALAEAQRLGMKEEEQEIQEKLHEHRC